MAEASDIFEANPQNFQADVVERSQRQPVVLLFWAEQLPEAAEAQRTLTALVPRYGGKVSLALVDVARDQSLAQHLRVQGLPSVRVVDKGQIAGQLDGPQPESAYTQMLDDLTLSSAEVEQQHLDHLLDGGDFEQALALLQQALEEEPNNQAFRVELADVLLRQAASGHEAALVDARQVLATLPEDAPERERPVERLALLEELAETPDRVTLEARVAADATDLEQKYLLAVRLAGEGNYEAALELALEILTQDRKFRDDGGRLLMLRIFRLLPKGAELASRYRRRLFAFLH
ncbi:MAG: tetratricopeptide repeat protein [Pseudomonadota bacterium]